MISAAVQKSLDQAYSDIYESKKATADQHAPACICEVCDWVANYEYEHGMIEEEPKCHCIEHCVC